MIYTGYYSKVKDYKEAGLTTVSISRTQPIGTDGKLESLAPDGKILWDHKNGIIDENVYKYKYLDAAMLFPPGAAHTSKT